MSKTTKKIIAAAVLLVLIAAAVFAWVKLSPKASPGEKEIFIQVVHGDGSTRDISLSTGAENLREALEPEGIISGEDSEHGMFVLTVDGETADSELQQWWCITKDGEQLNTGVDSTMIADGDKYEFSLTTGW